MDKTLRRLLYLVLLVLLMPGTVMAVMAGTHFVLK